MPRLDVDITVAHHGSLGRVDRVPGQQAAERVRGGLVGKAVLAGHAVGKQRPQAILLKLLYGAPVAVGVEVVTHARRLKRSQAVSQTRIGRKAAFLRMIMRKYLHHPRNVQPRHSGAVLCRRKHRHLQQGKGFVRRDQTGTSQFIQRAQKSAGHIGIGIIQRSVKIPEQVADRLHSDFLSSALSASFASVLSGSPSSGVSDSTLLTRAFSTR